MPPGTEFSGRDVTDAIAGSARSGNKRGSGILGLPMPPGGQDSPSAGGDDIDGSRKKAGKIRRKPRVIGKVPATARMSEDGSEWGERY